MQSIASCGMGRGSGAPIDHVITAPVREFAVISGLGATLIYQMLADGRLESITVGKRRLIVIDSYRRLIERSRNKPSDAPAACPSRPTRRRNAGVEVA